MNVQKSSVKLVLTVINFIVYGCVDYIFSLKTVKIWKIVLEKCILQF